MLGLRKVAITGGIASGKTSVCLFFKECGAYVVSADEIVHQLLSPHTLLGQQILQLLGPDILEKGQFHRGNIAKKIFNDPKKRLRLEELIHPPVFQEIEALYHQIKKQGTHALFVVEIPLLFETHRESQYDVTISVEADERLCRERLKQRGFSDTDYELRKQSQMPQQEKSKKADFVITNNGTLQELKEKVRELVAYLTQ